MPLIESVKALREVCDAAKKSMHAEDAINAIWREIRHQEKLFNGDSPTDIDIRNSLTQIKQILWSHGFYHNHHDDEAYRKEAHYKNEGYQPTKRIDNPDRPPGWSL